MKNLRRLCLIWLTPCLLTAANPLGVFDFNLRGATPSEQIRSLDGIGFEGITMPLNSAKDLARLEAYQKAKPDLKLIAALLHLQADKPLPLDHLKFVARKAAVMNAKLWLIVGGTKGDDEKILAVINQVAALAIAEKIGVSLYPHDNTAIETAEEALVYLKRSKRANLTISLHQCHELRAGNIDRLDAVVKAIGPHLDLVSICGSDRKTNDNSTDWSDAIKPLGEGDFDPKILLRVLRDNHFKGPIILHTFGLMKKPDSHYRSSFEQYQKMASEVEGVKR